MNANKVCKGHKAKIHKVYIHKAYIHTAYIHKAYMHKAYIHKACTCEYTALLNDGFLDSGSGLRIL